MLRELGAGDYDVLDTGLAGLSPTSRENVAMRLLFASVFPERAVVGDGPEVELSAALPGAQDGRWVA